MNDWQLFFFFLLLSATTVFLWQIKCILETIRDEIIGEITEKHKDDYSPDG